MAVKESTNDPLTFEKVWVLFQESGRRLAETEQQMKEAFAETDKQIKATNKQIGKLDGRFGQMIEHMVAPGISKKFNLLGFKFDDRCENRKVENEDRQVIIEIDLVLESRDIIMAVEVKSKPDTDDVDDHVKRILRFSEHLRGQGEKRIFMGALAGAIMSKEVRAYAHKRGLYVLEQSGDTVHIVSSDTFTPACW